MRRFVTLLAMLSSAVAQADLREKFQQELVNPSPRCVDGGVKETMRRRNVMYVAGINNGPVVGYWGDNASSTREDLAAARVTIEKPWSDRTITENADRLYAKLGREFRAGGQRKLVLVGHSKGGAEILLMALRHPDAIAMIDRLVLVEAVVRGADIPAAVEGGVRSSRRSVGSIYDFVGGRGLSSLAPSNVIPLIDGAIASLTAEQRARISEKVFYVRGAKSLEKMSPWVAASSSFQQKLYPGEPSDGAVRASQQMIPGFGTDLGVLDADHVDLLAPKPYSTTEAPYRRAFTRALFRELYEGKTEFAGLPLSCPIDDLSRRQPADGTVVCPHCN